MLTFKDFLLESGDFAHKFDHHPPDDHDDNHNYTFKHNDHHYEVQVEHRNSGKRQAAHISFSKTYKDITGKRQNFNKSKENSKDSIKILSTVHNIVKHHLMHHHGISNVHFTSKEDEPSRVALYKRYAEKHGGKTTRGSEDDPEDHMHTIPANNIRKS